VASHRKFFTVTGACCSYKISVMSPTDVEIVVYNPSGRGVFGTAGAACFAGAFLAAALAGLGAAGVCAPTARLRRDKLKTDKKILMLPA
jgi:rhodanese-related sulfurtransferase